MASIYELNQPPHNPFWDFITNIENHPFFNQHTTPQENAQQTGENQPNEPAHGAGPGPTRDTGAHGEHHHHHGWEGPHHHHPPPPYGFGPGFGHPFGGGPGAFGGRCRGWGGGPGGPGPSTFPHRRPGWGWGRGRGCGRGWGGRGWHQPNFPNPEQAREAGSSVAAFIQGLTSNLGIPLEQIFSQAQNQGQRQGQEQGQQPDFIPPVDIIDTPARIIVHVSLPGAKKEDLSVEYDAQESVLRVAGVVYRPGVDEELHNGLVIQERKDEVGVFERIVRLGTRENPARVVVAEISARLEDGVLRVIVPRVVDGEKKMGKNVVVEGDEDDDETIGEMEEYVRVDVQ